MKATSYLKKYTFQSIVAPLFKCLEACFELFVPLVIADIIDIGIKNNDMTYILHKGLLLAFLALMGLICTTIAQYFASKVAVSYTAELKSDLFSHIQRLSIADQEKLSTSSLIIRLTNDANQVQNGLNLALRLLLRSPIIVFGAFIMAFSIDKKLSMIFLIVIIILTIIVFAIMLLSIPLFSKVQSRQDTLAAQTRENIVGLRSIRAFRQQSKEKESFKDNDENLKNDQLKANRLTGLLNPLTYVLINVGIILVLYQSGVEVNIGTLSSGKVLALYNYMSQILVELIKLANLIIQINKALACLKRIDNILAIPEKEQPKQVEFKDTEDIIKFDHVYFRYPKNTKDNLHDLSFNIKRNSIIGIIGPTACGKTAIVNLINDFHKPTSGHIYINGIDSQEINDEQLHSIISLVPQKAVLFKGTVRSNMLFSNPNADDEMIKQALKDGQCSFLENKNGLDTEVSQGGSNFSGGQKQRLTIARGLVKHAPILILDDSSSALDYATERDLRTMLSNLKDTTLIVVSQRISSISFADKIMVMDEGNLVGFDTHENLLKNCSLYQEIYRSQNREENN